MLRIDVHPTHPQARLLTQAQLQLKSGALLVIPTDAGYSFAWQLDARDAQQRVERLRDLNQRHNFTLMCGDIKQAAQFARFEEQAFRFVRAHVPGAYTFIVPALSTLPKRLANAKKRSVGIRIPNHPVALGLLELMGEPIMVSSLILPNVDVVGMELDDLCDVLEHKVDMLLDVGPCPQEPTTVVDLLGAEIELLREGAGEIDWQ